MPRVSQRNAPTVPGTGVSARGNAAARRVTAPPGPAAAGIAAGPPPSAPRGAGPAARDYGVRTTFSQLSCLCLKISYPFAASASFIRCVITNVGSISPFWIRSSSG